MNDIIINKFWECVVKTKTCWNWIGKTDKCNLPIILTGKRSLGNFKEKSARRLSLELAGAILNSREKVISSCQKKLCVNPDHLCIGDIARFWNKVQKLSGDNSCWIWIGSEDIGGYGKFRITKPGIQSDQKAHRYSWSLLTGRPIPNGLIVCHSCDRPRCVRPEHLFLGTNLDNAEDRNQKNRQARGAAHGCSKLTEIAVREIRELYQLGNVSQRQLAKIYNVTQALISFIILNKKWSHIV